MCDEWLLHTVPKQRLEKSSTARMLDLDVPPVDLFALYLRATRTFPTKRQTELATEYFASVEFDGVRNQRSVLGAHADFVELSAQAPHPATR